MPKQGPSDGSRSDKAAFLPSWLKASARPMETVDLPSPAEVGVRAVTRMRLDDGNCVLSHWFVDCRGDV